MSNAFPDLMSRFRNGDEAAAAELVTRFGPQIRRAIRVRGTGSRLGRVLDSEDLMQSVYAILWQNRNDPALRVVGPGQLVEWLLTVARNRRNERARQAATAKRGGKHIDLGFEVLAAVPTGVQSPSAASADRDLIKMILDRLNPEERQIAEARSEGVSWAELADLAGTSSEALRKRFHRAVTPILESLASRDKEQVLQKRRE